MILPVRLGSIAWQLALPANTWSPPQSLTAGASLSDTETVKLHAAVKPAPSVAVKLFVVVPIGKRLPDERPEPCVTVAPQLSEEVTEYTTAAPHIPGLLLVTTFAGQVMDGGVTSVVVMANVYVPVLVLNPSTTA